MIIYIPVLLAVGFATTVSAVMCLAACQVHRYIRRKRSMNIHLGEVGDITKDLEVKKSLLLSSDEEEI